MRSTVLQECNARPVDLFSLPADYITHNATEPLIDTGGSLSEYMQLHLELYTTFFSIYAAVLPKTHVNTL